MEINKTESDDASDIMHHRAITLPDGRYMIFYTFGEAEPVSNEVDERCNDV